MNNQSRRPLRLLALASFTLSTAATHAEIVVGWETTGQTAWGTQGLLATSPSYKDPDITVGGLTRGAGFATTNTAVANGWGGHGIEGPENAADAITAENFVTFTLTPNATFEFSGSTLSFNYRRSGTGPTHAVIQYQIGAGTFADIADVELSSTSSTGGNVLGIDLASIPELQAVSGQAVTFRLVPYGATGADGTFYLYGPQPDFDFKIEGSVRTIGQTGDSEPPLVASLFPADDSTGTTADSAAMPTLVFNENITLGTGLIKVKNFATGADVASIDVSDINQVELVDNRLGLKLPALLAAGTSYYIEVPNTAILDLADTPNSFPGITGAANSTASGWNFTIAAGAAPPTVVVNEYVNATPDRVELLVVGNGVAGTTVDMRGMILKDFSSSTGGDGGRGFVFNSNTLWAAVPVGTLIVASNNSTSPDVVSSDFTLSVGLADTANFTPAVGSGATFDIATVEMVMIKAANSGFAGTTGGIHALSAGALPVPPAVSLFTSFSGPKLRPATGDTGTNEGVYATNSTSSLSDYSNIAGGAVADVAAGQWTLGAPNTSTNAAYISALRGLLPGDGDGVVAITNVTPASPYNGTPVFDDGVTGQSVKVTINAFIPSATIANATITIPASLGTPTTATLSGTGGTGSVSVSGQVITVNGASATTANALEVTINGLSTPVPTTTGYGAHTLAVSTRAAGGTLLPIATQPAVRVVAPISLVRNYDPTTRASLDLGATVAIEGIVSEADFGAGSASFSGFIQDSTGGINIFSASANPNLIRTNRFVVIGSVAQFNGLTEIIPLSASTVYNLGPVSEPVPQVVSLATLAADPEAYEGELITVQNLTYVSGTWGAGATVVLKDASATNIDIRIQSGSTATTAPAYPVNVTGVFGQFDSSSPYTVGYQLMPRDPADLAAGSASDYDTWATSPTGAAGGGSADPDGDGKDNSFEYAFGLSANSGGSVNPFAAPLNPATAKFRYTRRTQSLTGLTYKVFTSATLQAGSWVQDTTATQTVVGTAGDVQTVEVTLSAAAPLTTPKLFIRVVAE